MCGEREAVQKLAEVLHHVVAFELAVHQYIQTEVLLPADGLLGFPVNWRLVLLLRQFAPAEAEPELPHFIGLGEGPDCGCGI